MHNSVYLVCLVWSCIASSGIVLSFLMYGSVSAFFAGDVCWFVYVLLFLLFVLYCVVCSFLYSVFRLLFIVVLYTCFVYFVFWFMFWLFLLLFVFLMCLFLHTIIQTQRLNNNQTKKYIETFHSNNNKQHKPTHKQTMITIHNKTT